MKYISILGYKHENCVKMHYACNHENEKTVLLLLAIAKWHLERELRVLIDVNKRFRASLFN